MAPPPRPPIICYDLHTQANPRQSRRVSTNQRNLVDMKLSRFRPGVFDNHSRINELAKKEKLERQNARVVYSNGLKEAAELRKLERQNARLVYGNRLKEAAELREERLRSRREKQERIRELDEVSRQLEAIRQVQENLRETYGLSHRAAKYLQKQDEENEKLKQKMEKFSQVRSHELGSRIRQMKRFQELNKQQLDDKLEKDENVPLTDAKHYISKSTSPLKTSVSSDSAHHSAGDPSSPSSSSTISISSFSSLSSEDLRPMRHLVKPTPKTTSTTSPPAPILSSSFYKHSNPLKLTTPKSDMKSRFFKRKPITENQEILEITDLEFFDKIEDRTMLEVNELMNNLHAQLRE